MKKSIFLRLISFSVVFCIIFVFLSCYALANEIEAENIFNVADYMATGDGVSDDGAFIQDAFDACNEAGGGTVYFPARTYNVSKTVFFYSNQNIVFEDGAVIKRIVNSENPSSTCGVVLCNWFDTADTSAETSAISCSNVTISGGIFDGGGILPEEDPRNVAMVNTCHAENVTISNCTFINNYNAHCIEINSSDNVTVDNCKFNDYLGNSDNIRYNEMIQIDKCLNAALGSFFDDNSYRSIRGYNNETFVDYETPDSRGCSNMIISNCEFVSNEYCSAIGNHHQSSYPGINNMIFITNNIFSGGTSNRGYIVFDAYTSGIEIYGNTFYGGEYGVTVNAENADCNVYDNEFYDCKVVSKGDVNAYDNHVEGELEIEDGPVSFLDALRNFFNMFINFFKMLFGMQ